MIGKTFPRHQKIYVLHVFSQDAPQTPPEKQKCFPRPPRRHPRRARTPPKSIRKSIPRFHPPRSVWVLAPKTPSRRPQDVFKTSLGCPRRAQEEPRPPQDVPKTLQDHQICTQDARKIRFELDGFSNADPSLYDRGTPPCPDLASFQSPGGPQIDLDRL